MKMKYAEGGEVDNQRNKEIAQTILQQLGGGNRLVMMVGAYNFVIIPNGVAFRIKNAKANVIKITLNGLDLYNLEVGRMRGTTYKVVLKEENLYNDMLKPMIEKATGMYLSLYEKGGNIESEVDALYKKSQFINADENWKFKLLELLQDGSSEAYDVYQRLNAKQKAEVLQEQFEMDNGMGSDGDGKKSTSKENLMALLDDAKNGKKYAKGGAIKNKFVKQLEDAERIVHYRLLNDGGAKRMHEEVKKIVNKYGSAESKKTLASLGNRNWRDYSLNEPIGDKKLGEVLSNLKYSLKNDISKSSNKKMAKGGKTKPKQWVVNFYDDEDESSQTTYIMATSEDDAVEKGWRELSENGYHSDDFSVQSVYELKKNKMAKGGKTESKSVAVSKTISGNEINLFIDYCYGFYGKGGTYADELNGGLTKAQVKTAVMKYLDQLDSTPTWGGGDSLDRERVRLIFDKNYSLLKKGGKMAKGGGVKSEAEVWNNWNVEQRKHFLKDHRVFTNKAQDHRASLYRFDELPIDLVNSIKSILKEHISEVQYAKGGAVGSSDTPKIYVADLHAYNNGRLIGEWLDLGEYDNGEEVMEAIQQIVDKWKAKYGEEHEEFAIHDYENFSEDLYSEYMSEKSFDQVVKIYKISQEKGIPQEVLGSIAREYDVEGDDLEEWIDEHYEGQFDSDTDLAYNYVDMVGGVNELDKKTLENYFDYESFGRDLAYDYREFDGYYFRSYKRGGNIGKKYDLMKYLKMDSSGWNYSIGGL